MTGPLNRFRTAADEATFNPFFDAALQRALLAWFMIVLAAASDGPFMWLYFAASIILGLNAAMSITTWWRNYRGVTTQGAITVTEHVINIDGITTDTVLVLPMRGAK